MKQTATMTRKEMLEYIRNLKGMIRSLQAEILKRAKAPAKETDELLTDDVISAHRRPIKASDLTAICDMSPKGALCEQKGDWFLVLKPRS